MLRLFILGLLFALLVYLVKRKLGVNKQNTAAKKSPEANETMVKCVHCGVHLPVSESLNVNKKFYCSEAHLPP